MKLFLIVTLFFVCVTRSLFGCNGDPRLFIMLDIDNTVMDRIVPGNTLLEKTLEQEGYTVQHLTFTTYKAVSPKFYHLYQDPQQDIFATKLKILAVDIDAIVVEEISVIRPAIKTFIEGLMALNNHTIATYILVCSRNDNTRNQHLIDHLDLIINGKPFKSAVEFVPREAFRVEITVEGEPNVPAKSAVALREHYKGIHGPITANDYVVLVDQLPDNRFIVQDVTRDLNLPITGFEATAHGATERMRDAAELDAGLVTIRRFVKAHLIVEKPAA